jgi:hypothetical protein
MDMMSALLHLTLALSIGQPGQPDVDREWILAPQLSPGLELVYSGISTEETIGTSVTRSYRLQNHVLILGSEGKVSDVAFMTTLAVRDPNQTAKIAPSSIRLEFAKVDNQGRMKPLPGSTLHPPVAAPPIVETSCFVEAPPVRVGRGASWDVAEEGQPPRSWLIQGTEACGGSPCVKLLGQQQSDDWDRPRADCAAWRRRDVVWLSLQSGIAVKVERTVERRDPAHREPSHRTLTSYTLESRLRYPNKLFDDRKQEILLAHRVMTDTADFLKQATGDPARLDALLRKVAYHLQNRPSTPYRVALEHAVERVDHAKRGEIMTAGYLEESPARLGPLQTGQRVPDFITEELGTHAARRLSRSLGRPVLIFYYNPSTEIGVDILRFAKALGDKNGDRMSILAMAVTNDADAAIRQRATMDLPFPILDGGVMRIPFGVDATPRFIVLDADGVIRHQSTGWGSQIPDEIREHLTPRPVR